MRHPIPSIVAALALATSLALVPAAAQDGASVTFTEQTSDGQDVVVDEVTVPDGGFVVIHDATLAEGNVLGSVVGVSEKLDAGTHPRVTAHLFDHLDGDQRLIAMPHEDTNDDGVYSFVSTNGDVDGAYTSGGSAVTEGADVTVSATVTAADQPTEGRHVLVDRVGMEDGGFVAVHDDRLLDGTPVASVVGSSSFLSEGVHEDVRIRLDEEIAQNQTLVFTPHRDSDGDGSYDFVETAGQEDPPYTNHTGAAVIDGAEVTVSDTASATFADQGTGGHLVLVERLLVPDGGFVTIHDSSLAEGKTMESVRGTSSHLEPGLHKYVEVLLDDRLHSGDTLYAMPHKDTDDDETYDFVTSDGGDDGPYTEDGSAVTDAGEAHLSASAYHVRQSSDSRSLTVARVDLSEGGFVAVHDASLQAGAVFDSVVGVSEKLDAGVHRDVEVTFDEPLRDSQPLIPMPHEDSDDDGSYDFVSSQGSDDGPYRTSEGSPVVAPAFTEIRASVTAHDQTTEGSSVDVASATLTDGGFVTIHDASLFGGDAVGSVVGVSSYLDPGTAQDLEVTLDEDLQEDQQLVAMPHRDTDGDESYDFVSSQGAEDGPYVAAGGAVVDAFQVTLAGADGGDGGDGGADGGDGEDGDGAPAPGALAVLAAAGLSAAALRRREA